MWIKLETNHHTIIYRWGSPVNHQYQHQSIDHIERTNKLSTNVRRDGK